MDDEAAAKMKTEVEKKMSERHAVLKEKCVGFEQSAEFFI